MERKAILIKFSVESRNFESNTERNRFFRELYGWKQVVTKQEKKYTYEREGLLDQIPCTRIDKSMLLIRKEYVDEILSFLQEWENKVNWHMFNVLLDKEQEKLLEEGF
ncbi:MAG: hypothetical protein COY38_04145 [Candidatus Aenigmarchaeota archaeon CG_4_10_14_0_8_um_filter_37_24]|nr:hypothetical protein [Candidatus Aenigmarchaeota archaeon]OIN85910.1 MAG: hypothetical protein AUJ50_04550 [Candidatus Aenigmarchaeota archaeon CG1_02_38_14]PIV68825.1 MAG: hypothetical protein COS07_02855 [Candidatus Aenigmarchaeota archaeon CG01_land_8_20_14_3_00_37_9]PIW40854.1 MAG: hypothetical protein COW21_04925 [Candidatus Aenigmarchaeota archaeon CG15_BIG_FIL_POST_REV_8_21_14_020_37_27]PIX51118.1 MAG: hypothetical protein COZ52_00470 [Candidatus Aenigmarchaeota archaeon CG_4_8_14_3_u